jgi:hypothetical protein
MGEVDYWQQYKDGVATGRIAEDGTILEPDLAGYLEAQAEEEHLETVHSGGPCDCPPFDMDAHLAQLDREHRDEAHDGGPCDCPTEEPPF